MWLDGSQCAIKQPLEVPTPPLGRCWCIYIYIYVWSNFGGVLGGMRVCKYYTQSCSSGSMVYSIPNRNQWSVFKTSCDTPLHWLMTQNRKQKTCLLSSLHDWQWLGSMNPYVPSIINQIARISVSCESSASSTCFEVLLGNMHPRYLLYKS